MDSVTYELKKKNTSVSQKMTLLEKYCMILANKDKVFISAKNTKELMEEFAKNALDDFSDFQSSWNNLKLDEYMADNGKYRKRRYATFQTNHGNSNFRLIPNQPHYQGIEYNPLNGGIARHYEPFEESILQNQTLNNFIKFGRTIFDHLMPYVAWHIEAHQFRIEIDQQVSVGKPTPEGVHRDGVNYVIMLMINRKNVINGVTDIYDNYKNKIDSFMLQDPLDMAIINDRNLYHGVTPILQINSKEKGTRDVFVITYKRKTV